MSSEEDVKKYLSKIGKKGGDTTSKRHGKDYYKKISKLAHEARWGTKKQEQTSQSSS